MTGSLIHAAGAVLWRPGEHEPELALIHRPRYGDWSFPKGKRKRGEHVLAAAQREVFEETGMRPVFGRPLAPSFYDKNGRAKRVDYWCARAAGTAVEAPDPSEVDGLDWVPLSEAGDRLTHERDLPVLADFAGDRIRQTVPFVFVRQAVARSEADWFDAEALRGLNRRGRERAAQLRVLLAGYPKGSAYSATSAGCLETLLPYCAGEGVPLTGLPEFTGGTGDSAEAVARIERLADEGGPAVVCAPAETIDELVRRFCHRLDAPLPAGPLLSNGSFRVFHMAEGGIVAREHHD